ncbi:MAG: DUF309 domain-containing protein [Deltaproteobacteria bacterium]|nr:DUF309 domain-containing protein [Deltaproteobacteria bacterium]
MGLRTDADWSYHRRVRSEGWTMGGQGAMFDHHLFTGRVKFNEGRFFEAMQAFEKLLDGGPGGLDRHLVEGLLHLATGFELLCGRRMIDPAWVQLQEAAQALAQIPLATHLGIPVRAVKDQLATWLEHLACLGQQPGGQTSPPPRISV